MERVWSSLLLLPTIHKNPHLKPPLYTFLYTHDVIAYNNVEKKNHCSFVEKQTWQIKEKLKTQMTQIVFLKLFIVVRDSGFHVVILGFFFQVSDLDRVSEFSLIVRISKLLLKVQASHRKTFWRDWFRSFIDRKDIVGVNESPIGIWVINSKVKFPGFIGRSNEINPVTESIFDSGSHFQEDILVNF